MLSAPAAPIISQTQTSDPSGCSSADGSLTVIATGNNLEYSIDGGLNWQSSNVFMGLNAGNYTLIIRDGISTNCTATTAFALDGLTPPIIDNIQVSNPSDCGQNDATIVVDAQGNSLEYTIDGINWQTSNIFNGLAPADYTVEVRIIGSTDCSTSAPVTVDPLELPAIVMVNVTALDDCTTNNGSIIISATGEPLEYSIDGGMNWQDSDTFTGLGAGNYDIVVRLTGTTNCTVTSSASIAPLEVPQIDELIVIDPSDCGSVDGSITINASGSLMLEYSIDGINWQASNTFTGLAPGSYTVGVRLPQSNNCDVSEVAALVAPTEPSITQVVATDPSDCGNDNGSLLISAQGDNLEYSIDNGLSWQSSNSFSNLAAGTYSILVREIDAMSCAATSTQVLIAPMLPSIDAINVTDVSICEQSDGIITIEASGNNLEYSIDGGNTWQNSNVFTGLPASSYSIQVRIVNSPSCLVEAIAEILEDCDTDCNIEIITAIIETCNDNGTPTDNSDDFYELNVLANSTNGGASNGYFVSDGSMIWGPYTYGENNLLPDLEGGQQTVKLIFSDVDLSDCFAETLIDLPDCSINCKDPKVYIPNAFSPNYDGVNDVFTVYGKEDHCVEQIIDVSIFDRWGGQVYYTDIISLNSTQFGWDGTDKGKPANAGIYVYYVNVLLVDGRTIVLKGEVTLIR